MFCHGLSAYVGRGSPLAVAVLSQPQGTMRAGSGPPEGSLCQFCEVLIAVLLVVVHEAELSQVSPGPLWVHFLGPR